MLVALIVLAIIDLVVGVSNDAINFLNSAIGSKAISVRNILIIASFGIFIGAATSSGMMEVARKSIFIPGEFYFNEIMYIFMAVMITDILLLDVFNSLGMPTSTTVSIVFELLGAAVAIALVKISMNENETISNIGTYINSGKALQIILGILLSVVIAFSIGAIVQFISRLVYSFQYEKKKKYVNAIFGGIAITAITYFIFMKGLKGTDYYQGVKTYIEGKEILILGISFIFWTLIGQLLSVLTKFNVLKFIIGIGTFSLALAFAGNDLVNFIGVPIAALNSYEAWHEAWKATGVLASEFGMGILDTKVPTQTMLLFLAGGIMVVTLWFSKKAKKVADTEINLARQNDSSERFEANDISRSLVRAATRLSDFAEKVLPNRFISFIEKRLQKPVVNLPINKTRELPAFDMIRASVNLVVAGILISIATSFKLPLSTTYVTFMVAMGTSLADKAWGRESAVYRVAGVLNVIGGWFLTAFSAFTVAAIFAYIIYLGEIISVGFLLLLVLGIIGNNYIRFYRNAKIQKNEDKLQRTSTRNINNVIEESSNHVAKVIKRVKKLYNNVVTDLSNHDLNKLYKTEKHVRKLNKEIDELSSNVFDFIKSLDETSVKVSKFYILVLAYLQDVTQSIEYISTSSYNHVNNNHKNLKTSQINDLKSINEKLKVLLEQIESDFSRNSFLNFAVVINAKQELINEVTESIEKQITRIRTEESSRRNTKLYFGILLETKDLISATINLLDLYQEFHALYLKTKSD